MVDEFGLLKMSMNVLKSASAFSVGSAIDFWVVEAALKDYDAERANDDSAFRLLADLGFDAKCPAGDVKIDAWPCKGQRLGPGHRGDVRRRTDSRGDAGQVPVDDDGERRAQPGREVRGQHLLPGLGLAARRHAGERVGADVQPAEAGHGRADADERRPPPAGDADGQDDGEGLHHLDRAGGEGGEDQEQRVHAAYFGSGPLPVAVAYAVDMGEL